MPFFGFFLEGEAKKGEGDLFIYIKKGFSRNDQYIFRMVYVPCEIREIILRQRKILMWNTKIQLTHRPTFFIEDDDLTVYCWTLNRIQIRWFVSTLGNIYGTTMSVFAHGDWHLSFRACMFEDKLGRLLHPIIYGLDDDSDEEEELFREQDHIRSPHP